MANLRNLDRPIHAGVILTGGITEMLDVAPFEIFAWMNSNAIKLLGLPSDMTKDAVDIKLHWVNENGDLARMSNGTQVKPTDSFSTCPPLDIVLMGAHNLDYHLTEAEKQFINKAYEQCSAFLTMCGGIFALLESGLLSGMTVSVPRMGFTLMKKTAPHVNWVDRRWSRDGKLWSSSSLLNSTDCMRAFVTEVWGGQEGMVEALLDLGHWPERDVDFKDFHGSNYQVETLTR